MNRVGIYKVKMAFREADKWLQLIFYHLFCSASVKEDTYVVALHYGVFRERTDALLPCRPERSGTSPEWPEGLRCAKQLFHR